ncbi:MAG TPA: hypothetical protein VGO53_10450 [Steroidobacteraceae bacterium]|jgi:hypothetical protein|nr:hypothetical protein [Steroidobacteraceae bacterium]
MIQSATRLATVLCLVALTGCGHMPRMPWSAKPAPAPKAVNELIEAAADGTPTQAFPQYWKRNTLVVDLQSAAGAGGTLVLKRRDGAKWPVRLAFRLMPGSVGLIEVQGDQRLLVPVTREGTKAVDVELVPGVYTAKTVQITVKWEPLKAPVS